MLSKKLTLPSNCTVKRKKMSNPDLTMHKIDWTSHYCSRFVKRSKLQQSIRLSFFNGGDIGHWRLEIIHWRLVIGDHPIVKDRVFFFDSSILVFCPWYFDCFERWILWQCCLWYWLVLLPQGECWYRQRRHIGGKFRSLDKFFQLEHYGYTHLSYRRLSCLAISVKFWPKLNNS